jgi:hypothetical protein
MEITLFAEPVAHNGICWLDKELKCVWFESSSRFYFNGDFCGSAPSPTEAQQQIAAYPPEDVTISMESPK